MRGLPGMLGRHPFTKIGYSVGGGWGERVLAGACGELDWPEGPCPPDRMPRQSDDLRNPI